ncbi:MAG: hypothetical protein JOY90_05230 [Bradyrhizobium sp.]|nr:hypothetical protein [Bradyrhizobium sp.]
MRAVLIGSLLALVSTSSQGASPVALSPATMARLGAVDARFQSYNIEMVEVTGGFFWRPYRDQGKAVAPSNAGDIPPGMDSAMYAYRAPIDLAQARLRRLAAALGPAYLRVSGTWANSTYFDDADAPVSRPPPGFKGVLTRRQWQGVIGFARAVDAKLVTSFAIGDGVRDARGVWTPTQAERLIDATRALGGEIAAAEFMNEPDLPALGGAPRFYDAASFGRDVAVFRSFLERASAKTILLGPGSIGAETVSNDMLDSKDLLKAAGDAFDVVSYHHYGGISPRCSHATLSAAARDRQALSEDRLSGADRAQSFYAPLRDALAPGKPLWITETADAACGGNPWDSTFLDSFRYLDLLGRMARRGVEVVMHNTLAASDYGLLDERDFTPRPDYWAALLWRRLMGTTVLEAGAPLVRGLHLYAHCLRGRPGGVALLAINLDRTTAQSLELPMPAVRYMLTADHLTDARIRLNGRALALGADDGLPPLDGEAVAAGGIELPPATIVFLATTDVENPACR